MLPTSCPIFVGRDDQVAELSRRLTEARVGGTGGVVVVCGAAGIGKTRLADEVRSRATEAGMRVAVGRAVAGATPAPFRALSEALLAAFRADGVPSDPQLEAFRGHLGLLVPEWAAEQASDPSTLLVGEAIVRLLRAGDDRSGWLLVLDDLQWADADTLAVVEFLADTLAASRCCASSTSASTAPRRPDRRWSRASADDALV